MSKDKKPDLYDLFNDDSLWGTQETESLTHEEIMRDDWYKKKTAEQKEYFRQLNLKRVHNKEYFEHWLSIMQSPEMREKHRKSTEKLWGRETYRKKQSESQKEFYKNNPDALKQLAINTKENWSKSGFIQKNARPITTPYGTFTNVMPLTDILHDTDFGRKTKAGTDKKIRALLNSDKHADWVWLTWEEYDQLKS